MGQGRSGVGQPCRWCQVGYKQTSKAHQRACPVLWACGHQQHAFHTLRPSGQCPTSGHWKSSEQPWSFNSSRGMCGSGQPLLTQLSLPSTGPPSSTGQEMDTKDTEKRAGEDKSTEPQSKWQKASGKGDSNQGDQAVQDQRSQKRSSRNWF